MKLPFFLNLNTKTRMSYLRDGHTIGIINVINDIWAVPMITIDAHLHAGISFRVRFLIFGIFIQSETYLAQVLSKSYITLLGPLFDCFDYHGRFF